MSNTILCTVDFSASSKRVLQCAANLAKDLHVHLTILYTYRLIVNKNEEVFQSKKKIEEEAARNFALLEMEMLNNTGISYDFKTEIGFVGDRIEAHARKTPLDFIVIDKNMREESKETFDDLVGNTRVPMVIVPS